NQELFGAPSSLPWAIKISRAHRPPGYLQVPTFEPTFLYELIWNLVLASALVWLGSRRRIRAPGLFALYVAGYSGFRVFEETQRIDYSNHILGLRLNFFVALVLCLIGLLWFVALQRGFRGWGVEPAEVVPESARAAGPTRGLGFPRAAAAAAAGGSSQGSRASGAPARRPPPPPRKGSRGQRRH